MQAWGDALLEHSRHPTFHTEGWALEREVGFTCSCTGEERTWRIRLTSLAEQLPAARESFQRIRLGEYRREGHRLARETLHANRRAKALLHRHLRRDQRHELRGFGYFTVVGQDGHSYRVKEGTCQNVFLLEGDIETVRYCIVPDGIRIPTYDLMLAQKIMLECDIENFKKTANFYLIGVEGPRNQREPTPYTVTREDVDEPVLWAQRQLQAIHTTNGDEHGQPRQATG